MAQITLDRSANTLAGYFGAGYTTASSVTDSATDGGTLVINTALLRNYIGDAADTTNNSMTELLYSVLRRVEDTYNGAVGTGITVANGKHAILRSDPHQHPAGDGGCLNNRHARKAQERRSQGGAWVTIHPARFTSKRCAIYAPRTRQKVAQAVTD